ncbi:hypothetical protein BO94DRAFT_507594 [Aspergillus sclerotioniger CBS 115572]|uniref:Uncharacterized protein n=1 Tax=Aspergillus sclerotioniger CBS 115572 TaxID=1450535 RepID=A0A317XEA9_9EURO|nr:hypothetical protein BO94DRAFT_507594 [Aspergillus sclerotioniger CBS 115572]PWY96102.1 hypothetical protein BO94DRAFT_507594 [Aspergillus sclerotioniger CBS 115572]
MNPAPYFNNVTSESALKSRFQAENGTSIAELELASASDWDRPHLLACRVIRRKTQPHLLPILSQYVGPSEIQSFLPEIRAFIEGPDLTLMDQSEHYMIRNFNGGISLAQVWAALAMFKGCQDRHRYEEQHEYATDNEGAMEDEEDGAGKEDGEEHEGETEDEERQSKRRRMNTSQPGFIDSQGMRVGSSSPLPEGSGSQGSSLGYVDPDTHRLAIKPEGDTLRLVSCVIRHILYFAPPQNPALLPIVVEFRDAQSRMTATTINARYQMVAIDDGGLCLRRQKSGGGFKLAKRHVAILEAKPQFQWVEDGIPTISDRSFAQMVCEALATRLSDRGDRLLESVIIIHAAQLYICFLQMDVSDSYIHTFDNSLPTENLYVSATPWFDLGQKSGRESVLANLCGIMNRAISDEALLLS